MAKEMTFLAAMMDFFGCHPGQSAMQFAKEAKLAGNREFWIAGLEQNNYKINAASPIKIG